MSNAHSLSTRGAPRLCAAALFRAVRDSAAASAAAYGRELRIPVEAAVEGRVIVFAEGDREVDVVATRSSILIDARGKDSALRPTVLSHQAAQISEPVSAQKERESALAERQINSPAVGAGIADWWQALDAPRVVERG